MALNCYKCVTTEWYADSWEDYEHDGIDCEKEIEYFKTEDSISNLVYKQFPPKSTYKLGFPFENLDIKIRVSEPQGISYDDYYYREEEIYQHLPYNPKDKMTLTVKFTLEVKKINESEVNT